MPLLSFKISMFGKRFKYTKSQSLIHEKSKLRLKVDFIITSYRYILFQEREIQAKEISLL